MSLRSNGQFWGTPRASLTSFSLNFDRGRFGWHREPGPGSTTVAADRRAFMNRSPGQLFVLVLLKWFRIGRVRIGRPSDDLGDSKTRAIQKLRPFKKTA